MQSKKTTTIYFLLGAAWLLFAGWQGVEHYRFRSVAYEGLLNRAREIVRTMGVVIRSQGRFGMVRQSRLEAALEELSQTTDLRAVMLLNAEGSVVASAGQAVDLNLQNLPHKVPRWDKPNNLITIVDLVDLGSTEEDAAVKLPQAIVLDENSGPRPPGSGRPPFLPPGDRPSFPPPDIRRFSDHRSSQTLYRESVEANEISSASMPSSPPQRRPRDWAFQRDGSDRFRPRWMSEERYQEMLKKQGLHGFVLQLPIGEFSAQVRRDLWIRMTTALLALLAVAGIGLTWRNAERMNHLQIRLMRASETNAHLQDLNVAAAGLAHETRNPLNIVRGLAQIISQNTQAPTEIREKAGIITEEVDRVTGRLNEFINYSHSPEPHPAPANLRSITEDVQRTLESDLAENSISMEVEGPELIVEADEALLRQVIFNLLLNACQAVAQGGSIKARFEAIGKDLAVFEVLDDGPGVPAELRTEIYRPYYSTRPKGTGLGLAVVKQIILAHQWEIEYVDGLANAESGRPGAGFRVSQLRRIPARTE